MVVCSFIHLFVFEGGDGDRQSAGEVKNSYAVLLALTKPNISAGFQKLVKSLSQHVVLFKEEEDEEEVEMEIGFPTDVQHVAHIGCDGFNTSMSGKKKNWDGAPAVVLPLPPSSTQRFELAVAAAQAGAPPPNGPRASWPQ
ncbi:hypothetical protein BHE74_00010380 [Ensete ventricosum]|nr:hypothetical protein GW17_00027633 [Ensete ventricosum]RWW81249.1 hypothetical protein BHE74_00010380 [Ensete ventricosum]RZR88878.1 hypothetical protein BHM03_00016534 [Ensete ventricosum]